MKPEIWNIMINNKFHTVGHFQNIIEKSQKKTKSIHIYMTIHFPDLVQVFQ
jgi:hypothetical protein